MIKTKPQIRIPSHLVVVAMLCDQIGTEFGHLNAVSESFGRWLVCLALQTITLFVRFDFDAFHFVHTFQFVLERWRFD